MKKICIIFVIFLGIILFANHTLAACTWIGNTGTVTSPYGAADLQDCINDGNTKAGNVIIQIPDSLVTWTGKVTVDMQSGFTNVTSLTIRGQHDCTLDGYGVPTSCGTNISAPNISFIGKSDKVFRLAHMRLTGNSPSVAISIDGDSAYPAGGWRIDHIFFDTMNPGSRVIWLGRSNASYGLTNGVIDHVYVLDPSKIFFQYQPAQVDGGNLEWRNALDLGGPGAVYIEDSTLSLTTGNVSAPFIEGQGGGRFVIRYNRIHNGYLDAHDAIVTNLRGNRKMEVYENTFTYDANGTWVDPIIPRGGSGVAYDNTVTTVGIDVSNAFPQFAIYRYHGAGGNPWEYSPSNSAPGYTKAILDSSSYPVSCTSGTGCINIDGAGIGGYPARDQLGVDGNNPQIAGGAPFLVWNNTYNGNVVAPLISTGYGEGLMTNGVDYCYNATTKPTTCNGVAVTYSPYTYPHPLTLVSAPQSPPDTTPPAAPSGVSVM